MLILTRRVGESIVIGDNIKLTVLGIKGHQVRIGVDAPREVVVHRNEVQDRINEEKEAKKTENVKALEKVSDTSGEAAESK